MQTEKQPIRRKPRQRFEHLCFWLILDGDVDVLEPVSETLRDLLAGIPDTDLELLMSH